MAAPFGPTTQAKRQAMWLFRIIQYQHGLKQFRARVSPAGKRDQWADSMQGQMRGM